MEPPLRKQNGHFEVIMQALKNLEKLKRVIGIGGTSPQLGNFQCQTTC